MLIWECARHSFCIGLAVNFAIHIHLQKGGISMSECHGFITKFLHKSGEWLRRNSGKRPAFIWVLENPPSTMTGEDEFRGGLHLHVLIHVPRELVRPFQKRLRRWGQQAGLRWRRNVLRSRSIFYSGPEDDIFRFVEKGMMGMIAYLLKGSEPAACELLQIGHWSARNQGLLTGKRCGYSESLSPKKTCWPARRLERHPGIWLASQESRRGRIWDIVQDEWRDRKTG